MIYLIAQHQRCIGIIFIGGIWIIAATISEAQDLSAIDKKNPVKVTGGIKTLRVGIIKKAPLDAGLFIFFSLCLFTLL
jgi:hypothetical protein